MRILHPESLDYIEYVPDLGYRTSLRAHEVVDTGRFPDRFECGILTNAVVTLGEDGTQRIGLEMSMASHAYHGDLARFLYGPGEITIDEEIGFQPLVLSGRGLSLGVMYALARSPTNPRIAWSVVDVFMAGDCETPEGWALARSVITEAGIFAVGQKRDNNELVHVTLSLNDNDTEQRPFLASEFVSMLPSD